LLKTIFLDGIACRLPVFRRNEGAGRTRNGRLDFMKQGGTERGRVVNVL
jgi:hypothetical protein